MSTTKQSYFSRPKKYKKVVYEEASDSHLQENQHETSVLEEEIKEQDTNLEQHKQQQWLQQQQQQLPSKNKIKKFWLSKG